MKRVTGWPFATSRNPTQPSWHADGDECTLVTWQHTLVVVFRSSITKDCACVVTVLLVAGVRIDLTLSLGSLIRTLFLDLSLIGCAWVPTHDALLIPLRNALASAGGGDVGTLYIARDVMDRICSHIGASVDGLYLGTLLLVAKKSLRIFSDLKDV